MAAAAKADEAKADPPAAPDATNDGPTPEPDPPICVPCYAGVWPADNWRATCVHGKWERPDPALRNDETSA